MQAIAPRQDLHFAAILVLSFHHCCKRGFTMIRGFRLAGWVLAGIAASTGALAQPAGRGDGACADAAAAKSASPALGGQRTLLVDGLILGDGKCLDHSMLAAGFDGARAELGGAGSSRHLKFQGGTAGSGALVRPGSGYWDLRDYLQVTAKVRNTGTGHAWVSGRVESAHGNTAWTPSVEIPPGGSATLVIPFAGNSSVTLSDAAPPRYDSDSTTGVALRATNEGERAVVVDELRAGVLPAPRLPEWLGRNPPVQGDWKMTLSEDFNGNAIDESRWTATGINYGDKSSHVSKQNVIVADGKASLRFERRKGRLNDDPAQPETEYTTGYLSSVGKWAQRYGYFEARLKWPKAPGLWPGFWLMPDRGPNPANPKARQSTFDGGMEFDILEHPSRFGPYRYSVALHWDGYAEQHKKTDDDGIYVQPDAEGYVVVGMLWEPGTVAFFANGKEVAKRSDARIGNVPEYILLTLPAVGWGGNDLTGNGLPDTLSVDWVRAWQRAGR